MSKFIGVKMVEAVSMAAYQAVNMGYKVNTDDGDAKGYEITYPDGYKSWCPADVFEASYYQIQDNNGDIIYRNDVEGFINKSETIKIGQKTTLVTLNCLTGFEIHGQSSCVKPENYNQSVGKEYAKDDAVKVIWAHLGFVLQWAKYGLRKINKDETYITRMLAEQEALGDKITKLRMFIANNPIFNTLPKTKKNLMVKQLTAMDEYFHILEERIKEESVSK